MKKKILSFICLSIFGIAGIYLTFFYSNTSKYDSKATAYKIDPNETYDSEDGTTYSPIYYFRVNGDEYQCRSTTGSSFSPKESKNTVYYDSKNPNRCITEYEKSTSTTAGIICLVVEALILFFFVFRKDVPTGEEEVQPTEEFNEEKQMEMAENIEKINEAVDKIRLIVNRIVLGIMILILSIFIVIDTMIVKQTVKARNYIEVVASYVEKKSDGEVFDDYLYTFVDKKGIEQEIVVSISKDEVADDKIKIRYNEKNPQDYYEEGMTYGKKGIVWYVVKIIALILLIILFFNKRLLSKIGMNLSISKD